MGRGRAAGLLLAEAPFLLQKGQEAGAEPRPP